MSLIKLTETAELYTLNLKDIDILDELKRIEYNLNSLLMVIDNIDNSKINHKINSNVYDELDVVVNSKDFKNMLREQIVNEKTRKEVLLNLMINKNKPLD